MGRDAKVVEVMRGRVLTGLTAAAVLVLAGCGGDGDEGESSSSSSTVSPRTPESSSSSGGSESSSGSSTADETEPPAEAMEDTKAGAEAYATWFTQVMGQSRVDTDGDDVRRASSDSCARCKDVADVADDMRSSQHPAENPYLDVARTTIVSWDSTPTLRVEVKVPEHDAVDADSGEVVGKFEAQDVGFLVTLNRVDSGWQVAELDVALDEF